MVLAAIARANKADAELVTVQKVDEMFSGVVKKYAVTVGDEGLGREESALEYLRDTLSYPQELQIKKVNGKSYTVRVEFAEEETYEKSLEIMRGLNINFTI